MVKLHKIPRNFTTEDMPWKLLRHRKKLLQPTCKKTKSYNCTRYILVILTGVTEHKCGASDAAKQCFLLVTGPLTFNQVSLWRTYQNFFITHSWKRLSVKGRCANSCWHLIQGESRQGQTPGRWKWHGEPWFQSIIKSWTQAFDQKSNLPWCLQSKFGLVNGV